MSGVSVSRKGISFRIFLKFGAVIFLIFLQSYSVTALNDETDLKFTEEEIQALAKIKSNPELMNSLTDDYMNSDFYLIRFIREAKLDVAESVHLINETMIWRRANNISGILNEDWSDLMTLFPTEITSRDKTGRPVFQAISERWNVREEVYYGDPDRLGRFTTYLLEVLMHEILRSQKEGHFNVTRVVILIDTDGVGLSKHFCFSCMPLASGWLSNYQTYFPRAIDQFILTNSTFVLPWVLNILWPFMNLDTRDIIQSFTESENDSCLAYLNERIEKNQRLPEFGGTRTPNPLTAWNLHRNSCNTTSTSPSVARARLHSTPSFMAYLEYIVVLSVGLVIIGSCVCIAKVVWAKRRATRYAQCQVEENVKVAL